MRIAVCILTFRRLKELERLLTHLCQIEVSDPIESVDLLIVDNDPSGAALPTVRKARQHHSFPIHYFMERKKGISYGRNRCIEECIKGEYDVLVFIDDDEVPSKTWLSDLIGGLIKFHADAVAGPVLPRFEAAPPAWIRRGKFFDRRRLATGTAIRSSGAGNIAIRLDAIARSGLRFDERLALTGGEDTLFFRQFTGMGHSLIWVDEAYVYEYIPASRMSILWLIKRAFRIGNTAGFCERELSPVFPTVLLRFVKESVRIGFAAVLLPFSVFRGVGAMVQRTQVICRAAGRILGLMGFLYPEYASRHQD